MRLKAAPWCSCATGTSSLARFLCGLSRDPPEGVDRSLPKAPAGRVFPQDSDLLDRSPVVDRGKGKIAVYSKQAPDMLQLKRYETAYTNPPGEQGTR
jgi:hypothetical protein